MTPAQRAAIAVLAVAGGLAVAAELRHRDGVDAHEAILRVRTHRFDGSTRARLSTWLNQTEQQADARWAAHREGLFSRALTVTLDRPGAEQARFRWQGGAPQPLNPAAEAVIGAVRAHAARPRALTPPPPARRASSPPPQDSAPPVRPYVPDPASD